MRVLVTGGAGYVGSHTVLALIEAGHDVVVYDDLSKGHAAAVISPATLVQGDVRDERSLRPAMQGVDAIMHFASHSLVGESMQNPWKYFRDNVNGAMTVIETAVDLGVPKFVFSSTAALFGHPENVPIDEDERIEPGSPYGESKYMIERMLKWAETVHGLKSACLRYFNAAGADPEGRVGEDHTPETHLIPIVLQVALGQREQLTIFGDDYDTPDGTCVRDYIHVCDLASAHVLALTRLDKGSVKLNLGNGTGYSVKEVVETARTVTGHPIPTVDGERRPGDPPTLVASAERAKAELGWVPRFDSLEAIVSTAWNWHQKHPNGFAT